MLGHHRHASETPFSESPFQRRFTGGPVMVHFWCSLDPLSPFHLKNIFKKIRGQNFWTVWTPSDKTFWIHAWPSSISIRSTCQQWMLCLDCTVTMLVWAFADSICYKPGGGGGYSHIFFIRRLGRSIYCLPKKLSGISSTQKQYFKFCNQKLYPF